MPPLTEVDPLPTFCPAIGLPATICNQYTIKYMKKFSNMGIIKENNMLTQIAFVQVLEDDLYYLITWDYPYSDLNLNAHYNDDHSLEDVCP